MYNLRYSGPSVPKPEAIIAPYTKEQLINTVRCCQKEAMEIRVRCGGHSSEGTSSVATDGSPFIIIEMKNLDKVSVDKVGGFVWVQGGATLGQTYLSISQVTNDYTIPAGTWPTVGVGGHISGGGIGHLARKYGLAADHVVDALLIDAKGQVLDRKVMGEEVFWAIRGGGGGVFGIIFAWKIKLVAIPRVVTTFTGVRSEPKHDVATLFHKWQFVAPKLENEFSFVAFIGPNSENPKKIGNEIIITFKGIYQGLTGDVVSTLQRVFPELGVTAQDCREMSWIEAVLNFAGIPNATIFDLSDRYLTNNLYFKGKYDYVRTPIPIHGIRTAFNLLKKQPKGVISVEPLGGFMDGVASDSIPFPHRKGTIYGIQYEARWNKEDNEEGDVYIEWVREIHNAMTPYVSNSPRASYVNCIDLDLGTMNGSSSNKMEVARVWGEKYFLQNYDRLVKAKTIIDPDNVFRHRQGIPPMTSVTIGDRLLVSEMK